MLTNTVYCAYHCSFFFFCRHLGLDLVPRKDFEVVDSDQISVSDLYKMVRNLWDMPLSVHTGRERRGKISIFMNFLDWNNIVTFLVFDAIQQLPLAGTLLNSVWWEMQSLGSSTVKLWWHLAEVCSSGSEPDRWPCKLYWHTVKKS